MTKKQKRQVSNVTPATTAAPFAQAAAQRRFSGSTEFNPDYSPIKRGLKRIGILATLFVGMLVIISFFLR